MVGMLTAVASTEHTASMGISPLPRCSPSFLQFSSWVAFPSTNEAIMSNGLLLDIASPFHDEVLAHGVVVHGQPEFLLVQAYGVPRAFRWDLAGTE